ARAQPSHAGRESRFHKRAGHEREQHLSAGRTNRCLFTFDRSRRRFELASVHPGHTVAEVIENSGFDFDHAPRVPVTPSPSAETLRILRSIVAPQLVEVYRRFAADVFGVAEVA